MNVKQMKKQLVIAAVSVIMAGFALASATYAWFVSNSTVKATTSTISAQANGMVLQIAKGSQPIHDGSDSQTTAFDTGHEISPSSTEDCKNWYIPRSWSGTNVSSYQKANIKVPSSGSYELSKQNYYAYTLAEYTLYTINQTGEADVYLDNSTSEGPITITASDGASQQWFDKIKGSLRVGLVIGSGDDEQLMAVYAPVQPTDSGNDEKATEGWSCVNSSDSSLTSTKLPAYSRLSFRELVDQNNQNWGATKSGEAYVKPSGNAKKLAHVGYDGTSFKVVIWMEGTDHDCQNMSGLDSGTQNPTFNVSVSLVGVVPDSN